MPEVKDYSAAVARVRALQTKRASATDTDQKGNPKGHMPSETDPADKGTVTVPKDDRGSEHLPSSRPELTEGITPGAATVPGGELNGVGPTGTDVPKTVDGKGKETAATSPTTELSKIAGNAQATVARIQALRGKQASAPAAPVAAAAPVAPVAKQAADASVEPTLDTAMLCKLANTLLSTEEGVKLVEGQLVKAAGLEAARGILVAAQQQNEEYIKAANAQTEWQKSAAAQELAELQYAEHLLKHASQAELAEIEKIASVHQHTMSKIAHPFERACYQTGAMDAAYMLDSISGHAKKAGMPDPSGGGGAPPGMPPGGDPAGGAGGPPPGPPGEGGGAPMIPGGEQGPADIQQIAQILMQAVQSGEIDEAGAEQIMQILSQGGDPSQGGAPAGGDAGAPPGGAPDPSAGGGAPPADAAPGGDDMPPDVKAASALFAKLVPSK